MSPFFGGFRENTANGLKKSDYESAHRVSDDLSANHSGMQRDSNSIDVRFIHFSLQFVREKDVGFL